MFNHYSYSKLPIVTVWFGKRAILFDGIKWRHRRTAYGPCWQTPRPSGYGKLGQAIRQWIWSTPLLILMEFYGNSWFFNVYSNGNKGEGMRKPFLTKLTHKLTETEMWYNCDRVTSCFLFIIPQLSPTRNEWHRARQVRCASLKDKAPAWVFAARDHRKPWLRTGISPLPPWIGKNYGNLQMAFFDGYSRWSKWSCFGEWCDFGRCHHKRCLNLVEYASHISHVKVELYSHNLHLGLILW